MNVSCNCTEMLQEKYPKFKIKSVSEYNNLLGLEGDQNANIRNIDSDQ